MLLCIPHSDRDRSVVSLSYAIIRQNGQNGPPRFLILNHVAVVHVGVCWFMLVHVALLSCLYRIAGTSVLHIDCAGPCLRALENKG